MYFGMHSFKGNDVSSRPRLATGRSAMSIHQDKEIGRGDLGERNRGKAGLEGNLTIDYIEGGVLSISG